MGQELVRTSEGRTLPLFFSFLPHRNDHAFNNELNL